MTTLSRRKSKRFLSIEERSTRAGNICPPARSVRTTLASFSGLSPSSLAEIAGIHLTQIVRVVGGCSGLSSGLPEYSSRLDRNVHYALCHSKQRLWVGVRLGR
ncbi:hypothetical protein J6590_026986 [Homalodisca vitripennis]|nr:hypothetical protein J6590_026986 [Homalodisca vitripennis]